MEHASVRASAHQHRVADYFTSNSRPSMQVFLRLWKHLFATELWQDGGAGRRGGDMGVGRGDEGEGGVRAETGGTWEGSRDRMKGG